MVASNLSVTFLVSRSMKISRVVRHFFGLNIQYDTDNIQYDAKYMTQITNSMTQITYSMTRITYSMTRNT